MIAGGPRKTTPARTQSTSARPAITKRNTPIRRPVNVMLLPIVRSRESPIVSRLAYGTTPRLQLALAAVTEQGASQLDQACVVRFLLVVEHQDCSAAEHGSVQDSPKVNALAPCSLGRVHLQNDRENLPHKSSGTSHIVGRASLFPVIIRHHTFIPF